MTKESERVKAWAESKKRLCPVCKLIKIRHISKTCVKCHSIVRGTSYKNKTIVDLKEVHGRYWSGPIRENARRRFTGAKCCAICGYDKHYEVAHIVALSAQPLTARISEVNAPENLIGLCPNHHWEFDNGVLLIEDLPL
jgi:hypothetical protein